MADETIIEEKPAARQATSGQALIPERETPKPEEDTSPNVRLTHDPASKRRVRALTKVGLGGLPNIEMPSEDEQKAGFYFPYPDILIQAFPQYKRIILKAEEV